MTAIREAPIAYRMSTLKSSVSSGMITTPPPSPVSAPSRPAMTEPAKTARVKSKMIIVWETGRQVARPINGWLCFLADGYCLQALSQLEGGVSPVIEVQEAARTSTRQVAARLEE